MSEQLPPCPECKSELKKIIFILQTPPPFHGSTIVGKQIQEIFSNEINFSGYSIINGQVVLTPEADVEAVGFEEGQYNVVYNFLNNELSSSYFQRLYIDQISSDRTEIRLNTTQISNLDLINEANSLITQIQNSVGVYFDFFLNFD